MLKGILQIAFGRIGRCQVMVRTGQIRMCGIKYLFSDLEGFFVEFPSLFIVPQAIIGTSDIMAGKSQIRVVIKDCFGDLYRLLIVY